MRLKPTTAAVLYATMAQASSSHGGTRRRLRRGRRSASGSADAAARTARLHAAEPDRALELLQKVIDDRPRAVWARVWTA